MGDFLMLLVIYTYSGVHIHYATVWFTRSPVVSRSHDKFHIFNAFSLAKVRRLHDAPVTWNGGGQDPQM